MANLEITGGADLQKMLQELPVKIEKNLLRGALRAGAKEIELAVKSYVPVESGDLLRSIKVSTNFKNGKASAKLKAGDKKAFYAHMIEFGTGSFYAGSGNKSKRKEYKISAKKGSALNFAGGFIKSVNHPGIAPQPFMRPGFDSSYDKAIKTAMKYIETRLEKMAK